MSTVMLISAVWAVPLFGALAVRLVRSPARARALALTLAALTLAMAAVVFMRDSAQDAFARSDADVAPILFGVRYHVGVDGLSAVLLPLAALIGLSALLAAPRAELSPRAAAQILIAQGAILGVLVSLDALVLTLFWTLSLLPLRSELQRRGERAASAAFNVVFLGSTVPLILFVIALGVLDYWSGGGGERAPFDLIRLNHSGVLGSGLLATVLGSLVLLGVLARMGCFPLHLWIPSLAERGPGPLTLVSFATPIGLFLLARLAAPLFPGLSEQAMPLLLPLGLFSSLYGAVLALSQNDLRRLLGYFWMSQQGFLLVGMAAWNTTSISGALLHAISSVFCRSGLLLIAGAIAARTGTSDIRLLGGLITRAPRMATGFLLLSAAAVGFPGTLGFVSEDLLVQGLLLTHGLATAGLLIVTALNGILLYRAFKRTFLGPPSPHLQIMRGMEDFLPRERWVSVALVVLLLLGGFAPAPLLAVRKGVVSALHRDESTIPSAH